MKRTITATSTIDSFNVCKLLHVKPGTPIEDATVGKFLEITEADLRHAVCLKPDHSNMAAVLTQCSIANSHSRVTGKLAAIGRSIAYCVEGNAKGTGDILRRYLVPNISKIEFTKPSDTGKKKHRGGVILLPPNPAQRLDHKRKYQANRKKQIAAGNWHPDPVASAAAKRAGRSPLRSASGLIHI